MVDTLVALIIGIISGFVIGYNMGSELSSLMWSIPAAIFGFWIYIGIKELIKFFLASI